MTNVKLNPNGKTSMKYVGYWKFDINLLFGFCHLAFK